MPSASARRSGAKRLPARAEVTEPFDAPARCSLMIVIPWVLSDGSGEG